MSHASHTDLIVWADRVGALEAHIHGTIQKGPLMPRVQALQEMCYGQRTSQCMIDAIEALECSWLPQSTARHPPLAPPVSSLSRADCPMVVSRADTASKEALPQEQPRLCEKIVMSATTDQTSGATATSAPQTSGEANGSGLVALAASVSSSSSSSASSSSSCVPAAPVPPIAVDALPPSRDCRKPRKARKAVYRPRQVCGPDQSTGFVGGAGGGDREKCFLLFMWQYMPLTARSICPGAHNRTLQCFPHGMTARINPHQHPHKVVPFTNKQRWRTPTNKISCPRKGFV